MVDFKDRGGVERWLRGQPREVAIVLAARAALRVAPLLTGALGPRRDGLREVYREIILPVFRGVAASWVAGTWPNRGAELAAARADVARAADYAAGAARADAARAAYAARAASFAARADAARAADYAADAARAAAAYAYDAAWAAISADATALERPGPEGMPPLDLAIQVLWATGTPGWAADNWATLKRALLRDHDDWTVWTDWYEARLNGARFGLPNERLEVARVLIADEIWEQGPRVVNAEIKRLMEEYSQPPPSDAIPAQIPQALLFGGPDNAPIGQIDPPGDGLNDTPDQRQSHDDIRDKVGQLEASCGSSNRLAFLKANASKLLAAAGDTLLDLKIRAFWAQMNSLRRRYEADLRAREARDPESPPMPEEVAGVLQDVVETLNVFAAHEPKLVAIDDVKRDPADRVANDQTLAAARDIADAAKHAPQAIRREAAESLEQVAAEASGESPSAQRSKEFTAKSARNLILESLRRAYKGALSEVGFAWKGLREGAYRWTGAIGASYGAAVFIKANEAAVRILIDTLGGSPTLNHIVDLIIKALS